MPRRDVPPRAALAAVLAPRPRASRRARLRTRLGYSCSDQSAVADAVRALPRRLALAIRARASAARAFHAHLSFDAFICRCREAPSSEPGDSASVRRRVDRVPRSAGGLVAHDEVRVGSRLLRLPIVGCPRRRRLALRLARARGSRRSDANSRSNSTASSTCPTAAATVAARGEGRSMRPESRLRRPPLRERAVQLGLVLVCALAGLGADLRARDGGVELLPPSARRATVVAVIRGATRPPASRRRSAPARVGRAHERTSRAPRAARAARRAAHEPRSHLRGGSRSRRSPTTEPSRRA